MNLDKKIEHSLNLIEHAYKKSNGKLIATTSCGITSVLFIDLVAITELNIKVIFINTGFMFSETIDYFGILQNHYKSLNFIELKPAISKYEFFKTYGENIVKENHELCCKKNKIEVLDEYLKKNNINGWISAIRRDQTDIRRKKEEIEIDRNNIFKIHPLLNWSNDDVLKYLSNKSLPKHPLINKGYASIGCEPCTQKSAGREGRWHNSEKTECGLHL